MANKAVAIPEPRVIFSGPKRLWKTKHTLDVLLIEHQFYHVVELIAYDPAADVEPPRLYIDDRMLCARIDVGFVGNFIEQERENAIRRKERPDIDEYRRRAVDKARTDYILNRLSVASEESEPENFRVILQFTVSDMEDETGGPEVQEMIVLRPIKLRPYETHNRKLVTAEETEEALMRMHAERRQGRRHRLEAEDRERLANIVLEVKDRWRMPVVVNRVMRRKSLSLRDRAIWNKLLTRFAGMEGEEAEVVDRICAVMNAPLPDFVMPTLHGGVNAVREKAAPAGPKRGASARNLQGSNGGPRKHGQGEKRDGEGTGGTTGAVPPSRSGHSMSSAEASSARPAGRGDRPGEHEGKRMVGSQSASRPAVGAVGAGGAGGAADGQAPRKPGLPGRGGGDDGAGFAVAGIGGGFVGGVGAAHPQGAKPASKPPNTQQSQSGAENGRNKGSYQPRSSAASHGSKVGTVADKDGAGSAAGETVADEGNETGPRKGALPRFQRSADKHPGSKEDTAAGGRRASAGSAQDGQEGRAIGAAPRRPSADGGGSRARRGGAGERQRSAAAEGYIDIDDADADGSTGSAAGEAALINEEAVLKDSADSAAAKGASDASFAAKPSTRPGRSNFKGAAKNAAAVPPRMADGDHYISKDPVPRQNKNLFYPGPSRHFLSGLGAALGMRSRSSTAAVNKGVTATAPGDDEPVAAGAGAQSGEGVTHESSRANSAAGLEASAKSGATASTARLSPLARKHTPPRGASLHGAGLGTAGAGDSDHSPRSTGRREHSFQHHKYSHPVPRLALIGDGDQGAGATTPPALTPKPSPRRHKHESLTSQTKGATISRMWSALIGGSGSSSSSPSKVATMS